MFAALGLGDAAIAYRRTTLERFRNPFLRHRLRDIAANHEAKKQRRFAALMQIAAARRARYSPTPLGGRVAVRRDTCRLTHRLASNPLGRPLSDMNRVHAGDASRPRPHNGGLRT